MDNFNIVLQLFAEGGDGGAAAAAGGDATGVQAPDAGVRNNRRKRENPLANVQYGIGNQTSTQPDATAQQAAEQGKDNTEESFESLIKGKYKSDFDSHVQNILQQRFKKNADNDALLESYKPLMEAIGKKFNVDPTDVDGMLNAVSFDEEALEEEAMQRGMSTESLKTVKELERKAEKLNKLEQQSAAQQRMQAHFTQLSQQAEAAKAMYPGFDLMAELNNPTFARLTAPGVGIDAKTAYEIVHKDEIMAANAQAQAQKISKAIQANGARPAENGLNAGQSASTVKTDPRTLTRADREEIKRRVARGEKVVF